MRTLLLLLVLSLAGSLCGQHLTYREWQEQSFRDMRLMPEYGHRAKNPEQRASDSAFVAQTLAAIPDPAVASDHLVDLGFGLLREGNLTHAMFRFNQAYLVEPTNAAIYRGYGAFFVALDRHTEAAQLYQEGLQLDSTDSSLMTDMAAVFLAEYYRIKDNEPDKAEQLVKGAKGLSERALHFDPENKEAAFKLSVAHLRMNDCKKAMEAFERCKALGWTAPNGTFEAELRRKCPQ